MDNDVDEKKELNTSDKNGEKLIAKVKKRKAYYEQRYAKALSESEDDMAYYRGVQWRSDEIDQMKNEEGELTRPVLTLNQIRRFVNFLRGKQAENRYWFKVLPMDNVDPNEVVMYDGQQISIDDLCERLTEELKKVENENDGSFYLSDCFLEAVAGSGRSYLEVYVDIDESEFPYKKKVMFEFRSYKNCFSDPDHKKYDLSDSKDFIKLTEYSKDDLISMFPDKKKIIRDLKKENEELHTKDNKDSKDSDGTELSYVEDTKSLETAKKDDEDLILVEYFDYEWLEEYLLVLPNSGQPPVKIPKEKEAAVRKANEEQQLIDPMHRFELYKLKRKCWYVSSYASGELLGREKYEVNGVPITRLPFAEYSSDRVASISDLKLRDISVTRELKSAQDMYNKGKSEMLAHLLSSTHSGIVAESGALENPDDWMDFGSSPGFVGYVKKGMWGKWQKLDPSQLSQGHAYITQDAVQEMQHISNINPDLLGNKDSDSSGRAIALRQQAGSTGTAFYFDNFRRTKHILCKIMLEFICALKGVDFKALKVVVDDTAESPTARYANWLETREMLESGAFQSPFGDLIIDGMNFNNREEWKQRWVQNSEFMKWKQEQQMKAEAEKMAIEDARKEGLIPNGQQPSAA